MAASTDLATLRVNVIAQTRDFKRGMQDVRRESRNVGKELRDIGRSLAVFTAMAAGAFWAAKKMFDLAAAVEETASKYRTVFGPAVDEVNRFIAQNARLMGLTTREAQDVVATTAAIAQGMGFAKRESATFSVAMTKLAGDLASFNNVPIEDTSRAIQAALTGERESMKRLGVVILETDVQQRAMAMSGVKNAKALTQQQKALATLSLIGERAGVAVGDLARTQDSAANRSRAWGAQVREIRDDFVVGLMPALGAVLAVIQDMTPSVGNFVRSFKQHAQVIARVGEVIGDVIRAVVMSFVALARTAFNVGQMIGEVFNLIVHRDLEQFKNAVSGHGDDIQAGLIGAVDAFKELLTFSDKVAKIDLGGGGGSVTNIIDFDANVRGMNELQASARSLASAFSDSLADSIHGVEDAFKSFIDMAIRELLRLAAKFAVFKMLGGGLAGTLTGPGGFLAGLFGSFELPGRAHGGPVSGGSPYVVGEKGPELFVPKQSGSIVPNNAVAPTYDFSNFPAPTNPLAMARDAQWMRFLTESLENAKAGGYQMATNG